VGTELATSADAPSLGVVYKLVEIEDAGGRRYPVKLSQDKHTLPGAKQVFRYADHDMLGLATECPACTCEPGKTACQALQRPVIVGGELVEPLPSAAAARAHAEASLGRLPAYCLSLFEGKEDWPVELSAELAALAGRVRQGVTV
jgi:nicotinate phosphoribosyltransferase